MARPGFNLPPPKPKKKRGGSGGGSGGSGGSGGGGGSRSGGRSLYPGVRVFGERISRAQFQQAFQHYNDMFLSTLGRRATRREVERILNQGLSDYQVNIAMMKKPGFVRGPAFKSYLAQLNAITGTTMSNKLAANLMRNAARHPGGVSEASLRASILASSRARANVTQSFRATSGADVDYLTGAFGGGRLTPAQYQALALQKSGLRSTTMGATVESRLEQALQRMRRIFEGQLASPQLSLNSGGRIQIGSDQGQGDLPA